ncbi:TraB/GumN family protein [Vibrio sp. SCSIO 43140]|uniref:TraB/GumN family protein n=1 Tax=Vibrio sp. SCSIO 43140 TaxID=2819100 RepID=UPI002074DE3C|nr:TraB/GumN family protein [Vibrio sp. SCSIO 43140]USD59822.1 TraB/GumN family protein [Vibrio sp. SCSIO 43140]
MFASLRIAFVLLSVFLTTVISASAYAQPLLFKAERGDQTFYIYGTVHVGPKNQITITKQIEDVLGVSDSLILEAKMDQSVQFPTTSRFQVAQVLEQNELKQLETIASEIGIDFGTLQSLPPWHAALILQQTTFTQLNYYSEFGSEHQLSDWAKGNGITIDGLETLQFQIDLLSQQDEGGKEMLKQTLLEWPHNAHNIQCLLASWKAGDIKNLSAMLEHDSDSSDFLKSLLIDRNDAWVAKLTNSSQYQKGTYFVAVGALHLVGPNSVIGLLRSNGYSMTQLSRSEEAKCTMKTHE